MYTWQHPIRQCHSPNDVDGGKSQILNVNLNIGYMYVFSIKEIIINDAENINSIFRNLSFCGLWSTSYHVECIQNNTLTLQQGSLKRLNKITRENKLFLKTHFNFNFKFQISNLTF